MTLHNNIGLVLCGGQSTRMGQDKGQLRYHGLSWAERAGWLLEQLHLPVYYSVNTTQLHTYPAHLSFIPDDARVQAAGPLKGLLSAHLQHPQANLFVLACDLRDMELAPLAHLQALHQENTVTIFTNDGQDEPLAGIYPAACLAARYAQPLSRHSMKAALQHLPVQRLPLPSKWKAAFANFNAPSDFPSPHGISYL
ncbi:hypothetical protein DCC81_08230 [Chitinophaga parva]|uniref:MobA-like NTP transferase domain-containing protein n=1 Tax=Chitinophaga parva TaxID=2169414 RepID=A0A2T7BP21_9BACT|nr:molybdenum cofactor guanylyltransferase [Chitinophaga parva]PUZ29423.1 hypothetical protein DCC81_08230 [Chitinophaga parva]